MDSGAGSPECKDPCHVLEVARLTRPATGDGGSPSPTPHLSPVNDDHPGPFKPLLDAELFSGSAPELAAFSSRTVRDPEQVPRPGKPGLLRRLSPRLCLLAASFALLLFMWTLIPVVVAVAELETPAVIHTQRQWDTARLPDQVVLQLHPDAPTDPAALSALLGERVVAVRRSAMGHVVTLAGPSVPGRANAVTERLQSHPMVLGAEEDIKVYPYKVPNDPSWAQQWFSKGNTAAPYGMNLPDAWNISTGSGSMVVAVVDTGVLQHQDLPALLPGYDMIGDVANANDGDGRDPNATDPGDSVTTARASSWHGTFCTGIIGAVGNNSVGVAGVNWNVRILPVRVLGINGGTFSDALDGIRWAAGLNVTGVPPNPNKARVISVSLGGTGQCSASMQAQIDQVVATGAVIVVAAGNENDDARNHIPASCANVITVAAHGPTGARASYSNFGPRVDIMAPGGDIQTSWSQGILSTTNTGSNGPAADSYAWEQGTSFATPHVAGLAALMLTVNPSLAPATVTQILKRTARAFVDAECQGGKGCGAGLADAAAAVRYARYSTWTPTPTPTVTNVVRTAFVSGCRDLRVDLTTAGWPSEVGWFIDGAFPAVSYAPGTYTTAGTFSYGPCVLPGPYTFVLLDSYGDGWNGGYFQIKIGAVQLLNGTMNTGKRLEMTFVVPSAALPASPSPSPVRMSPSPLPPPTTSTSSSLSPSSLPSPSTSPSSSPVRTSPSLLPSPPSEASASPSPSSPPTAFMSLPTSLSPGGLTSTAPAFPSTPPAVSTPAAFPSPPPTTSTPAAFPSMPPAASTPAASPSKPPSTPPAFPSTPPAVSTPAAFPSPPPTTSTPPASPLKPPTSRSTPPDFPSKSPAFSSHASILPSTPPAAATPPASPSTPPVFLFYFPSPAAGPASPAPSASHPPAFPSPPPTTSTPAAFPSMPPAASTPAASPSKPPSTPPAFPSTPPAVSTPAAFPSPPPTTSTPAAFPSMPPAASTPAASPSKPPSTPPAFPSPPPTTSTPAAFPSMPPAASTPAAFPSKPPSTPPAFPSTPPAVSTPAAFPSPPPTTSTPATFPSMPPAASTPAASPSKPPSTPPAFPSTPPAVSTPAAFPSPPPTTSTPAAFPSMPPAASTPAASPSKPPSTPPAFPSTPPAVSTPAAFPSPPPTTSTPAAFPSMPPAASTPAASPSKPPSTPPAFPSTPPAISTPAAFPSPPPTTSTPAAFPSMPPAAPTPAASPSKPPS
eukprot:EG_transcript_953